MKLVEKSDMAKRKPYQYKWRTVEKMERIRKEKRIKREKMMTDFTAINMLDFEDIDQNYLCNKQKILID